MSCCSYRSILAFVILIVAAAGVARADDRSADGVWTTVGAVPPAHAQGTPWVRPDRFQGALLDNAALANLLAPAPLEDTPQANLAPITLTLPTPDGLFYRFRVVESPVMEPALAAQFPQIKTYLGQGIDDPWATLRADTTPAGFHAQVLTPNGSYYIDPYTQGDTVFYASYYKPDLADHHGFSCEVFRSPVPFNPGGFGDRSSGGTRRQYRLCVAATGEYTAYHGGTVAAGQAAIVTAVNRITGVYELEVGVRMVLVANNSSVVYTNASTDPYSNTNGSAMLGQNITTLNSVIGSANYDIGHVFSTGGGGVAYLGVVCTSNKAGGVTGSGAPTGDAFWIDYVAHEMGHQFGGNHCFNGSTTNCGSNRAASAAYEPGSGSTIMSYAGVCAAADNLQPHSDAYFVHKSYDEIMAFISTGSGNSCDVPTTTGNTPPTVSAGASYTIPQNTPFLLTATGSDVDGDAVSFCWEERDLGPAQPASGAGSADNGSSPILRSFNPTTSPSRTIPKLTSLLNNTTAIGEQLPITNRILHFRCTARDNRAGSGGVNASDMTVTVTTAAGPFQVTSPNTNVSWTGAQTVTWNVASTTAAPVSCANVRILLSTNGGTTWAYTLAAGTPNDGSEVVTLPSVSTTQARIRVEAVGNIFFDISNVNFTITPGPPADATGVAANPSTSCTGQSVQLTANPVGGGELIYWYTGGCGPTGATLVGTGIPLTVNPLVTTTYYAHNRRVSDGVWSAGCASATVTVTPLPTAPTSASVDRDGFCSNDPGTITLSAVGGSGTTLRWLADSCAGTPVGVGTPLVIDSPTVTTTYFVRWENSCGVTSCTSVPVWVRTADYNGDGFVDGIDYDQFNNDFESPDPAQQIHADYNHDGFVDGIDYDMFNNDFEVGC